MTIHTLHRRTAPATLVTGASSGIGRSVAHQLAERGAVLALVARRREELEQVALECRQRGSARVAVLPADVGDEDALGGAFKEAAAELGPIGNVVHAAAIAGYGRFEQIPAAVFDRVLEVNVSGTANVARAALLQFDHAGLQGNLVLFGSVVGRISTPYLSPYVTSKWAVRGLARTLQAEQRNGGHRISLIEPGGVDTTIYQKAASYLGVQGKPPPPVLDAEEVARVAVALLDHPRRQRSVGLLNPVMRFGFGLVPAVYDLLVGPLMGLLALGDEPVAAHDGNAFDPVPEPVAERVRSRARSLA